MQFLLLLIILDLSSSADLRKNLRYISETQFEFSIEVYREIAKSRPGNLVISANNINVGLSLLFLGTTSNTTSSRELRWVSPFVSKLKYLRILGNEYSLFMNIFVRFPWFDPISKRQWKLYENDKSNSLIFKESSPLWKSILRQYSQVMERSSWSFVWFILQIGTWLREPSWTLCAKGGWN